MRQDNLVTENDQIVGKQTGPIFFICYVGNAGKHFVVCDYADMRDTFKQNSNEFDKHRQNLNKLTCINYILMAPSYWFKSYLPTKDMSWPIFLGLTIASVVHMKNKHLLLRD